MIETTRKVAKTTDLHVVNDVLDDALRSLRIQGSLLLREGYAPPWAVTIPEAEALAALVAPTAQGRVVAFHLVERGQCNLITASGESMTIHAGEIAICFGGGAHTLCVGDARSPQPLESLLAGNPNAQAPAPAGGGTGVSLICGVFRLHHVSFNPLFTALPAFMRVNIGGARQFHNLGGAAQLLADEIGRTTFGKGYIAERLLEVLCAEAIRAHIETLSQPDVGWLRGITDPVIGRAIRAIHLRPCEGWSVPLMARGVTMSPSRFAARFAAAVGDSPMAYVSKWRMNLACRQLSSTDGSIDQIAQDAGYDSAPAFNRAFKKYLGVTPVAWRNRQRE